MGCRALLAETTLNTVLIPLFRSVPVLFSRRRHAFKRQLLQTTCGLGDIEVALGVGGDVVAGAELARHFNHAEKVQALAVEDCDSLAGANV